MAGHPAEGLPESLRARLTWPSDRQHQPEASSPQPAPPPPAAPPAPAPAPAPASPAAEPAASKQQQLQRAHSTTSSNARRAPIQFNLPPPTGREQQQPLTTPLECSSRDVTARAAGTTPKRRAGSSPQHTGSATKQPRLDGAGGGTSQGAAAGSTLQQRRLQQGAAMSPVLQRQLQQGAPMVQGYEWLLPSRRQQQQRRPAGAAKPTQADAQAEQHTQSIQARRSSLLPPQLRGMTLSRALSHPGNWTQACQVLGLDGGLLDGPLVSMARRPDAEVAASCRLAAAAASPVNPDAPLPPPAADEGVHIQLLQRLINRYEAHNKQPWALPVYTLPGGGDADGDVAAGLRDELYPLLLPPETQGVLWQAKA